MAFVFEEVMAANVGKVTKVVEWLGDTGASRHVCNDLSLMQDVRTREKPILPRQLVETSTSTPPGRCSWSAPTIQGAAQSSAFSTPATFPAQKSTSSAFKS